MLGKYLIKSISFDFAVLILNFRVSPFFPHEPLKSMYTQRRESLMFYLVPCLREGFAPAHTGGLRILPPSALNITAWAQGYKNVRLER